MPRLRKVSEEAAAVVVVSIDGALVSLPSVKGIRVYDPPPHTLGFRKLITRMAWWGFCAVIIGSNHTNVGVLAGMCET